MQRSKNLQSSLSLSSSLTGLALIGALLYNILETDVEFSVVQSLRADEFNVPEVFKADALGEFNTEELVRVVSSAGSSGIASESCCCCLS